MFCIVLYCTARVLSLSENVRQVSFFRRSVICSKVLNAPVLGCQQNCDQQFQIIISNHGDEQK